jgi:hypothetical protein
LVPGAPDSPRLLASDLSQTLAFSAPQCLPGTPTALPVPLLATLRNKPSSGETRTLPPICTWLLSGDGPANAAPNGMFGAALIALSVAAGARRS